MSFNYSYQLLHQFVNSYFASALRKILKMINFWRKCSIVKLTGSLQICRRWWMCVCVNYLFNSE